MTLLILLDYASVLIFALTGALSLLVPQDARQTLRDLQKEYDAERARYDEEVARLSGEEAAAFRAEWNPTPAFVEIMLEHAGELAGAESKVQHMFVS